MADDDLERTYAQMVEQSRLRGEAESARAERERRTHPRVRPDAAPIVVADDPWVYPINVSKAGLAFFSDVPHPPGTRLPIHLENGPTAEATVVECAPETAEPAALAGAYRISCAFADAEAGLRFFLALKSLEAAALDTGGE